MDNKTKRIACLTCVLIVALCAVMCACGAEKTVKKNKIFLTVNCSEAVAAGIRDEEAFKTMIPESGTMLTVKDLEVDEGCTLETAIRTALADNGVVFIIQDGYISAVNGLEEGHMGGASGWLYYVNGTVPMEGISKTVVNDGDAIELRYVTDFSKYFS